MAAHIVYALYALALLFGLTAVIGVIVVYVVRGSSRGTWLESHHRWQIRTFWFTTLFNVIGAVMTVIGIGWAIIFAATLWFIWRVAKGWVRLAHDQPVEDPIAWV